MIATLVFEKDPIACKCLAMRNFMLPPSILPLEWERSNWPVVAILFLGYICPPGRRSLTSPIAVLLARIWSVAPLYVILRHHVRRI